jgi:flavin-dependent dehydrogenase
MRESSDHDVIVVGSGFGGSVAALRTRRSRRRSGVLAVWAVAGTLLAVALGGRVMEPGETEAAAAAGAAV